MNPNVRSETERMLRALLASGQNQTELAKRLAVSQGTISKYLQGFQEPKSTAYAAIRSAYEALESGHQASTIPILGYVGLGEDVDYVGEGDHAFDHIDVPGLRIDEGMAALIGRGTSMWPRVNEGEVIVYRRNGKTAADLVNREAVVKILDGPVLFKRLRMGSTLGKFRLESHNAPPREAEVDWVGELVGIIPEGAWRKVE